MPSVYSAKCSACGNQPNAEWRCQPFFEDTRRDSNFFCDQGMAYENELGVIIAIPHPGEAGTLKRMGVSISEASAEGMLLGQQTMVCNQCGLVCENLQVASSNHWVGLTLLFGISIAFFARFYGELNWLTCFTLGIICMIIGGYIIDQFHHCRHQKRNMALRLKSCPACGDQNLRPIGDVTKTAMPCAHCKARSMVFEFFARS